MSDDQVRKLATELRGRRDLAVKLAMAERVRLGIETPPDTYIAGAAGAYALACTLVAAALGYPSIDDLADQASDDLAAGDHFAYAPTRVERRSGEDRRVNRDRAALLADSHAERRSGEDRRRSYDPSYRELLAARADNPVIPADRVVETRRSIVERIGSVFGAHI